MIFCSCLYIPAINSAPAHIVVTFLRVRGGKWNKNTHRQKTRRSLTLNNDDLLIYGSVEEHTRLEHKLIFFMLDVVLYLYTTVWDKENVCRPYSPTDPDGTVASFGNQI